MKITGELLKSERLQKNLTVQDVAFALKLSSKIIIAIEAGQTESLPAKTFIRGFVKSYAQYLKIDSEQVMRQFQEEMGSTHPLPKNPPPVAAPTTNGTISTKQAVQKKSENKQLAQDSTTILNDSKSSKSFIYIGVAVVLVILIVATNRIVDRYQKESVVDPNATATVQPLEPTQTTADTAASVALSADSTGTSSEKLNVKSDTQTSNELSQQQSEQKNILPTLPTSTPKVLAGNEPADGFEPSNGKPIEVIIEAKKDLELMYARGNTSAFSKIKLISKQVQVIRSPAGLYLKSDDGGAFHIVVNGIEKGQAGANNKPIKLSF